MIELPEHIWKNCNHIGVYLIYDFDNDIVYIGKSVNVYSRIAYHHSDRNNNVELTQASKINYIPVSDNKKAALLELALIKHLKPEWNKTLADIDITYSEYLLLEEYNLFDVSRVCRKSNRSKPLSDFKLQVKKGDLFILANGHKRNINHIAKSIGKKCSDIGHCDAGWSLLVTDEEQKTKVINNYNNYIII